MHPEASLDWLSCRNRQLLVIQPLRQLAADYEALRQVEDYSRTRTQKMADIVR
jgi:hypothetical protein